jgi:enoyl-CoA hydratase/carnithine racemase
MSDRVSVTITDGVADVRMTRVDKRNALDSAQFAAIIEAGESLKNESGLRAVVLSGEGRSFCAGIDLSGFQRANNGEPRPEQGEHPSASTLPDGAITHVAQQACWVWQELSVPVIAAVHGHALGGGFQLALGADIRFVHPDTQLSLREVYWGLIPDMTGSLTLASLVRADVLKDLLFTARIFDGREGYELGVVTRLTENPYEDAHEYARLLAGQNPDSLRAGKALVNGFLHERAAQQFAAERNLIATLSGTANQAETIAANLENRPAVYRS